MQLLTIRRCSVLAHHTEMLRHFTTACSHMLLLRAATSFLWCLACVAELEPQASSPCAYESLLCVHGSGNSVSLAAQLFHTGLRIKDPEYELGLLVHTQPFLIVRRVSSCLSPLKCTLVTPVSWRSLYQTYVLSVAAAVVE